MKQTNFFLLSLAILFTTIIAHAQPNLGVYPTILEYHLSGGQSESKSIHLTNNSPDTVQFRMYINDWFRDTMGGHAYFRADTLPQLVLNGLRSTRTLFNWKQANQPMLP